MSTAAAIAVGITSKNNNNKAIVDDSRDGEMSTQTASTAAAPTSGAGVTSATAVPISGDLSSRTSPSTHQPTPSTVSHHSLEQHCRLLEEENQQLKETETRLQQQYADSQRRERLLMRRLANKEQELQEYVAQIAEYKNSQAPGPVALRSAMLDPAVNILFEKLKNELQSTRAKLEETQNELSAWKFTPDSNTGKRLMAKCRLLYQENEELGKMTSNGRLAKLEGELAMQKSFNEEVKKSQSELDDFIQELDEDVEGMQSTILFLQQELKAAKDKIVQLEKDNCQVKKMDCDDDDDEVDNGRQLVNGTSSPTTISGREISDSYVSEERTPKYNKNSTTYHIVHNSNNSIILRTSNLLSDDASRKNNLYNGNYNDLSVNVNGGGSDMDKAQNEITSTAASSGNSSYLESSGSNNSGTVNSKANKNAGGQKKRSYDSDSSENSSTNGGCTLRSNKKLKKKARRSSVLSIDLNEEDTQIADESDEEDATMSANVLPAQATTSASNQRIMTRRKSARNHQNGDH